ncbi:MAG: cytochrome C oxidase subunit IV family protein [Planctomycetota bacterium]|nr:cytochrome C oxidase subunit IV family protein [Planctomycetota bacterium]
MSDQGNPPHSNSGHGPEEVAHGPLVDRTDLSVAHQLEHDYHDPDQDHGHSGLGKYIVVFVLLCLLTAASFFTQSDLWPFHGQQKITWAFMIAVSCTKAMLVILFFMHVKYEANWKYVLTIPAGMMSIFLMVMLIPDVGMRVNGMGDFAGKYSQERFLYAAEPGGDTLPSEKHEPSANGKDDHQHAPKAEQPTAGH